MKFSPDFIEKVRDANNIIDIVSQYTQLKPMAGGYMGRCPFPDHQEKTASFSVSETKQVYNCFGCHKKGNIFTFIQNYMGLSFPESVEYLAGRANISLPVFSQEENDKQDLVAKKKKTILALNKIVTDFYFNQFQILPQNHPAKIYAFEKRGLKQETINDFKIGYAPENWDSLAKHIEAKGFSMQLAEEAKLVKLRKEGTGYFDIFRDRLMFPIVNQLNETLGFGGRIIQQGEPKYLNSGETLVFNKGKILYGLNQTSKYIRGEDQAIIVEGYMDLVSLYQEGVRNTAATMGTALTYDHGKLLQRMTQNVVALFDGDEAGQNAAERSLPILLGTDTHPKGIILPDGQDPDDFVKSNGVESLQSLILKSSDLFSMVLNSWLKNFRGDASDKIKICDQLKPVFSSIQDNRLKKLYFDEVAQKLSVDQRWLLESLDLKKKSTPPRPQVEGSSNLGPKVPLSAKSSTLDFIEDENDQIILKGASTPESLLVGFSLKNINYFNKINESRVIDRIQNHGVKKLLEKIAINSRQVPEKFDKLASLFTSLVDLPDLLFLPEMKDEGLEEFEQQEKEARLLNDCIKRVIDDSLKMQAENLARDLKSEPTPEKMEQFMNIQRERIALQKEQ